MRRANIDHKPAGFSGKIAVVETTTKQDLIFIKSFEWAAQMNKKQIAAIFIGVTLLYAGVLTLAEDLYAGIGMMVGGSTLVLLPLWKAFGHFRSLSSGSAEHSRKTVRRKKKTHLKLVQSDEQERPTYH